MRPQRAAGQRPEPLERRHAPLPEQDVQAVAADLEDHGQRLVREPLARPGLPGRLVPPRPLAASRSASPRFIF